MYEANELEKIFFFGGKQPKYNTSKGKLWCIILNVNKLELLLSRIFLVGEKVKVAHLLEVLGSQTGIPKGLKKIGNSRGEENF